MKSKTLVVLACVLAVFIGVYTAQTFLNSLYVHGGAGIAPWSDMQSAYCHLTLKGRQSFWTRFVTVRDVEYHDDYYTLVEAWVPDRYTGIGTVDSATGEASLKKQGVILLSLGEGKMRNYASLEGSQLDILLKVKRHQDYWGEVGEVTTTNPFSRIGVRFLWMNRDMFYQERLPKGVLRKGLRAGCQPLNAIEGGLRQCKHLLSHR